MPLKSLLQVGDKVRLNFPGSKLHGTIGTIKAPRPPAGWWTVRADGPLLIDDEASEADQDFAAPDSWLEKVVRGKGGVLRTEARKASVGRRRRAGEP